MTKYRIREKILLLAVMTAIAVGLTITIITSDYKLED